MAFDFPSAPADGQVYTDATSGASYTYSTATGAWLLTPSQGPSLAALYPDSWIEFQTLGNSATVNYSAKCGELLVTVDDPTRLNPAFNDLGAKYRSSDNKYVHSFRFASSAEKYKLYFNPLGTLHDVSFNDKIVGMGTRYATFSGLTQLAGASAGPLDLTQTNILELSGAIESNVPVLLPRILAYYTLSGRTPGMPKAFPENSPMYTQMRNNRIPIRVESLDMSSHEDFSGTFPVSVSVSGQLNYSNWRGSNHVFSLGTAGSFVGTSFNLSNNSQLNDLQGFNYFQATNCDFTTIADCALPQDQIDTVLDRIATITQLRNGRLFLNGGTNAAPGTTGQAAIAKLTTAPYAWTIQTN